MDATKKRAQKLEAKGQAVDFKKMLRKEPDAGTTKRSIATMPAAWLRTNVLHPCEGVIERQIA
jgi:hypothetical protein